MSLSVNSFIATLASSLTAAGSETEIFLSTITTLTGEVINTSDFSIFGRGTLTVDPLSSTNIEFISFTAVSSSDTSVTGAIRGLSAKGDTASTGRAKYHPVGTKVIISFGVHNLSDIVTYVAGLVAGGLGTASDTVSGSLKITENLGARPRALSALANQQPSPNMTILVPPFALASLSNNISYAGGNSPTFVAPVTNPRIDLLAYNIDSASIVIRGGTEAVSPVIPAPTNNDIVLCSVFLRVGSTTIIERDVAPNTQSYIKGWYTPSVFSSNVEAAGKLAPFALRTAPAAWLAANGTDVSCAAYPTLFAALNPSGTCTVTIASPAVFTKTAHGLVAGDQIFLRTTGALPTGLSTNVHYYVISTSLSTDSFEVALSPGGSAVVTSGTQSGVHTLYASAFGKGDGLTTFTLPNLNGSIPLGLGTSSKSLAFESGAVDTSNDWITILDTVYPSQGQAIVLTTTGALPTGLSTSTTYYVIRITATTIGFATTAANAAAGTKIDLTGVGSGVSTLTFTGRGYTVLGRAGGEDAHAESLTETGPHSHGVFTGFVSGGTSGYSATNIGLTQANLPSAGSGNPHNNLMPFISVLWCVKT